MSSEQVMVWWPFIEVLLNLLVFLFLLGFCGLLLFFMGMGLLELWRVSPWVVKRK